MMKNYRIGGLFEKFPLIKKFITIYNNEREKFNNDINISSIYGSNKTIWGGGRYIGTDIPNEKDVADFMKTVPNISPCLVVSNLLLKESHLNDSDGLEMLDAFKDFDNMEFIVGCDTMFCYLKGLGYTPEDSFISSVTKCLENEHEINDEFVNYKRVVINENKIKDYGYLFNLPEWKRKKTEILVNGACPTKCLYRKEHYIEYSSECLHLKKHKPHLCISGDSKSGPLYKLIKQPLFIKREDVDLYSNNGISNFKIQGRTNYNLDYIETLLYYLVKPEYWLEIRQRLMLGENLCI